MMLLILTTFLSIAIADESFDEWFAQMNKEMEEFDQEFKDIQFSMPGIGGSTYSDCGFYGTQDEDKLQISDQYNAISDVSISSWSLTAIVRAVYQIPDFIIAFSENLNDIPYACGEPKTDADADVDVMAKILEPIALRKASQNRIQWLRKYHSVVGKDYDTISKKITSKLGKQNPIELTGLDEGYFYILTAQFKNNDQATCGLDLLFDKSKKPPTFPLPNMLIKPAESTCLAPENDQVFVIPFNFEDIGQINSISVEFGPYFQFWSHDDCLDSKGWKVQQVQQVQQVLDASSLTFTLKFPKNAQENLPIYVQVIVETTKGTYLGLSNYRLMKSEHITEDLITEMTEQQLPEASDLATYINTITQMQAQQTFDKLNQGTQDKHENGPVLQFVLGQCDLKQSLPLSIKRIVDATIDIFNELAQESIDTTRNKGCPPQGNCDGLSPCTQGSNGQFYCDCKLETTQGPSCEFTVPTFKKIQTCINKAIGNGLNLDPNEQVNLIGKFLASNLIQTRENLNNAKESIFESINKSTTLEMATLTAQQVFESIINMKYQLQYLDGLNATDFTNITSDEILIRILELPSIVKYSLRQLSKYVKEATEISTDLIVAKVVTLSEARKGSIQLGTSIVNPDTREELSRANVTIPPQMTDARVKSVQLILFDPDFFYLQSQDAPVLSIAMLDENGKEVIMPEDTNRRFEFTIPTYTNGRSGIDLKVVNVQQGLQNKTDYGNFDTANSSNSSNITNSSSSTSTSLPSSSSTVSLITPTPTVDSGTGRMLQYQEIYNTYMYNGCNITSVNASIIYGFCNTLNNTDLAIVDRETQTVEDLYVAPVISKEDTSGRVLVIASILLMQII